MPYFPVFQNKEWVELKCLEMTPELSHLAPSLDEAQQLQQQHDDVLQKLAVSVGSAKSEVEGRRPKSSDQRNIEQDCKDTAFTLVFDQDADEK